MSKEHHISSLYQAETVLNFRLTTRKRVEGHLPKEDIVKDTKALTIFLNLLSINSDTSHMAGGWKCSLRLQSANQAKLAPAMPHMISIQTSFGAYKLEGGH